MNRRYVTIDVFTQQMFGGNPLAVVLDAEGLSTAQMQAIAREFNYAETTFILAPSNTDHAAQVRIFTPKIEVPFAGHPNIGTAIVLGRDIEERGGPVIDRLIFEELAGLVPMRLFREAGMIAAAELTAPEPLSIRSSVSVEDVAACLSLAPRDINIDVHAPQVLSVGLPFLVTEVRLRESLAKAKPHLPAHERVLPTVGTDAVYAYVRGSGAGELHARCFAPLDATPEDPATGSATAATIALLASLHPDMDAEMHWRIEQGVDMGRPSLLQGRTVKRAGMVTAVYIAGQAVPVMRGVLNV
jgi:trans-2,3-dihydro-3-hydroxyanthranilate isomerase